MIRLLAAACTCAFLFADAVAAQTLPPTYQPVPAISLPGDHQPVLPTDVILGARVQSFGGTLGFSDYGALPITDFAFAADVAKTNAGLVSGLGGGASSDANGNLVAPRYVMQGKTYSDVGSALSAEDATVTSLAAGMTSLSERVGTLQQFAYDARREARGGIAATMAMSSASMPSAPGRTSWVVNVSNFRDQQAVGGSMAHRFDTRLPFALTAGFAFSASGAAQNGARIGLAGEF